MELTSKEKINKFSKSMVTVTKVGKIFSIIGIVGCAIALVMLGVAAIQYDWFLEYLKANPDTVGNLEINLSESGNVFVVMFDKLTLLDLWQNKDLAIAVLEDAAVECFGGLITCIITLILMNLIKGIFVKLEKSESPFNTELNKDLKKSFIAITILVLFNASWIVALIVGLTLLVVYYLYQYGASLQKDVDETI